VNETTAICIVNYNLPEITDRLIGRLQGVLQYPHRFYVLDNGSDKAAPARNTTHRVEPNRRPTGGWNEILLHARADADYAAYWIICNDVEFPQDACPLTPLMNGLYGRDSRRPGFERCGIIHAAVGRNSKTAWREMYHRPGAGTVENWAVDWLAPLIRGDVLKVVWPFDAALKYGYGVDNEACYLARRAGFKVGICHDVIVEHEPFTTYRKGMDSLSVDEYKQTAGRNMHEVLARKYGKDWKRVFKEGGR